MTFKNLKDLAEVSGGYPFRGTVPEYPNGAAFAVQMRDVSPDGAVNWGGLVRTQLGGKADSYWLRSKDILFVTRGMRFFAVCLDEVPQPTVCSPHFFLVRIKAPDLLAEFLAWQINQQPAQRYLRQNAEGSNQLSIRRGTLEELPIAIPALAQQQQVVALASLALKERTLQEALIKNREQQLHAIAKRMLQTN